MSELSKKLEEYGLDQKSSKIYLSLLKNADSSVYQIAKDVQIPRTTVYNLLEKLESQNLVSSWKKNNVKHYSCENPNALKLSLKEKEKVIDEIFGDLKSLFRNNNEDPKTRVLTGKEGVKYAFEHILETMINEKVTIAYVFAEPQLTETLPKFFLEWRDRKNKSTETFTYLIAPKEVSSHPHYGSDSRRETRELTRDHPFFGSLDIIGSNVYFFSFKKDEIYSIIIESKIVSDMMTNMFLYIWNDLVEKK